MKKTASSDTKKKNANNGGYMNLHNSEKTPGTLVMGIGNFLLGDEGVGVHFITQYEKALTGLEVDFLDGGTGGFHLMSYLEVHPKVILIDATMDGQPAGTITRLKPKFAKDFPTALSAHDIGLKDLIEALILCEKLPEIYLFTVSIAEIQHMVTELSPMVAGTLPGLFEQVKTLIEQIQTEEALRS